MTFAYLLLAIAYIISGTHPLTGGMFALASALFVLAKWVTDSMNEYRKFCDEHD